MEFQGVQFKQKINMNDNIDTSHSSTNEAFNLKAE